MSSEPNAYTMVMFHVVIAEVCAAALLIYGIGYVILLVWKKTRENRKWHD